jgi:hypothetical protein
MRLEGLGKLEILIHLIGSRTRDLPACRLVPQPLRNVELINYLKAQQVSLRICKLVTNLEAIRFP